MLKGVKAVPVSGRTTEARIFPVPFTPSKMVTVPVKFTEKTSA
jgi:hypothetical protein